MHAPCRRWLALLCLAVAALCPLFARAADEPLPPRKGAAPKTDDFSKPAPDESPDPRSFVYTTDEAIELFTYKVKINPKDHTSFAILGDLYERKARETDDLASYEKAENALRKALEVFPAYTRAKISLAVVLCDRHKFAEGLELGRAVAKENPKSIDALVVIGDAQIELGQYEEAEASIRELAQRLPVPAAQVRLARLLELKGQTAEAEALLRRAIEGATSKGETGEGLAWYKFRLAEFLLEANRVDEAEALYKGVLKDVAKHHDATFGMGRVLAARGQFPEAIAFYEKAVAIGPDPHMLAALGDLYAKTGDTTRARACYDRLEKNTASQAEYRRSLCVFYSDHDLKHAEALALARKDFEERKDIYGYDALAWALLKNGRADEAAKAIAEALKLGTKDARLHYHAGMIYLRLGDKAKAREELSGALALNPHFSVLQVEAARRALADLDGATKPGSDRPR